MFVHQQLYIAALLSESLEIGCKPPIDHTSKKLRVQARFWRESVLQIFVWNTWYLPSPNLTYFAKEFSLLTWKNERNGILTVCLSLCLIILNNHARLNLWIFAGEPEIINKFSYTKLLGVKTMEFVGRILLMGQWLEQFYEIVKKINK